MSDPRGETLREPTDPGDRSPATIEREVERTRAHLTRTLDELRDRVSPGQMMDQLADWAKGSGGAEFARNLGAQVRDNPLPILLVGAGIGWLMVSGGGNGRGDRWVRGRDAGGRRRMLPAMDDYDRDEAWSGRAAPATGATDAGDLAGQGHGGSSMAAARGVASGVAQRTRGAAAQAGDAVAGAAHWAEDAASSAGDRIAGAASDAADRVSGATASAYQGVVGAAASAYSGARDAIGGTAGEAGERAREMARSARGYAASGARQAGTMAERGWGWVVRDQPLVLGAIGLAIGAAIGAALPRTEAEDELMGEARDDLMRRGRRVAETGYAAVSERAGEHLGRIGEAASGAAGEARDRLGGGNAQDAVKQAGGALGRVAGDVTGAVREALQGAAADAKDAIRNAGSDAAPPQDEARTRQGTEQHAAAGAATAVPTPRPAPPATGPVPDARRSNPL